jgi:hypothetical protein
MNRDKTVTVTPPTVDSNYRGQQQGESCWLKQVGGTRGFLSEGCKAVRQIKESG